VKKPPRYIFAIGLNVYVASRIENLEAVAKLCGMLEAEGHKITYNWSTHGRIWDPERVPGENSVRMANVAEKEARGVADADVVVVLLPGGRGTHVELGMAIAGKKSIVLCSEKPLIEEIKPFRKGGLAGPCAFHFHPDVQHLIEPDPTLRLERAVRTVRSITIGRRFNP
jgi:hypothetical protein